MSKAHVCLSNKIWLREQKCKRLSKNCILLSIKLTSGIIHPPHFSMISTAAEQSKKVKVSGGRSACGKGCHLIVHGSQTWNIYRNEAVGPLLTHARSMIWYYKYIYIYVWRHRQVNGWMNGDI